jgi:hypothetical protein
MRPIFTARLAVLLTSVAPLALPVLAMAQTAQPQASPSIDDIVVTARRSEESIQSTPVSVWTLGDVRVCLNLSGFVGYYDGVQIALSGLLTQPGCVAGDPVFGEAPYSPDGDCSADNDPQSGTMLANAGKSRVAGQGFNTAIFGPPRQYGLTLRYRLGE